ncbi:MAG: adenylate cyclase, partial [Ruminiclostridium sp.]|nr:adenylate cyclase [Ruminiclostridium sp.]
YPIEAHWIWGGGWLAQMGFVDFAGSCAIHMVGGISALIGAAFLGARIGKFGKDGKPKAILGHSIPLGALGVFILWFGWYGFNGAAASDVNYLAQIFLTTTIAPAVATCTTMIFTWLKNGKPDVSMCLNASLAGLVAITAPCADVDALGATIIGLVAGLLVCFGVWLLDYKLKVDDPVGAVAVHGFNGLWGTLAVGLFATGNGQDGITGLFYGGGFNQLGIQALGVLAVGGWTVVTMTIVFWVIKHTIGLRASKEEELKGLDLTEHGLPSSYADFVVTGDSILANDSVTAVTEVAPVETAVPVQHVEKTKSTITASDVKMTKVDIITNQEKFEVLKHALSSIGITGMTVSHVMGCGMQKGSTEFYRGVPVEARLLPKMKVEIVVCKVPVDKVVEAAKNALYTGKIGDGKIFVYDVENVIKVRTGEEAYEALQDNE